MSPEAAVPLPFPDADAWNAAPFGRREAEELRAILARLGPAQRLWLSGYLAGTAERGVQPVAQAPAVAAEPVTILFGSQSGNGERLAQQLGERLAARGIPVKQLDMLECRKADLERMRTVFVIVSTHGDGEPPERALPLHELLHGRRAPRLEQLRYAVLALGDSSYEQFCATGRQFDERLEALGATRLHARVECDVDYDTAAGAWMDTAVTTAAAGQPEAAGTVAEARPAAPPQVHTRKNPCQSEVLLNQRLTMRGSTKDVRHIELAIEGSGMHYEPGDALGIVPHNPDAQVDALLAATGFDAEAPVQSGGSELSLREALGHRFEIGTLTPGFLKRYAEAAGDASLAALAAGDAAQVAGYIHGRDLRDLVAAHPPQGLDAAAFAALLRPLAPRLYSIASSARANPGEVHLTVGIVEYDSLERHRQGVVSGHLAACAEGDMVPVYLHRNPAFRLPPDSASPIVMIGAGTGVAPYRGFMAEREATGATGRNWLVFGDRNFELDFLYQAEWLGWRRRGLLSRLDVAFSRDQPQRVYVQDRLREQGARLWEWLQEDARIYVCGDASRMAPDVDRALLAIACQHGGLSEEGAREYLLDLQRDRRYQKDVY